MSLGTLHLGRDDSRRPQSVGLCSVTVDAGGPSNRRNKSGCHLPSPSPAPRPFSLPALELFSTVPFPLPAGFPFCEVLSFQDIQYPNRANVSKPAPGNYYYSKGDICKSYALCVLATWQKGTRATSRRCCQGSVTSILPHPEAHSNFH